MEKSNELEQQQQPSKTEDQSIHSINNDEPTTPETTLVDGGLKGWLCVAGSFFTQFCSFGFLNACGIFQYHYETSLLSDHSSSAIAWIVTFQLFLMFFIGPVVGMLVDVYGPRRIVIPASAITVFGCAILGSCKTYWQVFLAQGVVYGLGASGLFLPGVLTVGLWFQKRRGLALGIVSTGGSLGGIIYPLYLTPLIEKLGFPSAVRYTALMMGVFLLFSIFTITSPIPPKGWVKKESSGLVVFKNQGFILFCLGCFFTFLGLFGPINYLPLMAVQKGFSENLSSYTISILNAAAVPGRIIPSYISDSQGTLTIITILVTLSSLIVLCFWLPLNFYPSHPGILVMAALYGFVSGGFIGIMMPTLMSMTPPGKGSPGDLGVRMGGFMTIVALACLVGLPVQGALIDKYHGQFTGLMIFSGVCIFAGAVVMCSLRVSKGGWSLKNKV